MDSLTDDTTLVIRRTLAAPVERVYRAWTDPAWLSRWFAATPEHECVLAETDLRVGGRYRLIMRAPDGEEHRVSGEYREIETGRKLVFTWAWESTPERESQVTINLHAKETGTVLVLTHERFADVTTRDRHNQGWTGCLDTLERVLATA